MDYVNAPVGRGMAPPAALLPLIAVPTTTGTGAESTAVCVMDVLSRKVKTGISHARLRPTLAVIDPDLAMTQPAGVTAASGMDVLCHALESYTARPHTSYEHKTADQRVPYCGSSTRWSRTACRSRSPPRRPSGSPSTPAPKRHIRAARVLAPDAPVPDDPRDLLPGVLSDLMRAVGMPNGIGAVGYDESDIDDLVAGASQQKRLLDTCPRPVTDDGLAAIFHASMQLW